MSSKGPNGNSIFIPALGFAVQNSHQNIGQIGAYWSKNIDASDDDKDWGANCMIVAPGDPSVEQRIVAFDAYVGAMVRPVME